MWKKLFKAIAKWLSKKENREKLGDAVEKGAEVISKKIEKREKNDGTD